MRTFSCVSSLVFLDYHALTELLPIKCTSRHLVAIPARIRCQRRTFIAVVPVPTRHTPVSQSPVASPNVSRGIHGMEDLPRQPLAAHRGILRSHECSTVRASTDQCRSWSPAAARKRVDAYHPERDSRTRRTHAQDRPGAGRLCCALGHAPARVFFWRRD